MILLSFLGVAVNSKINFAFRLVSISSDKSDVALWLSSTITTGSRLRITLISEVSSLSGNAVAFVSKEDK